jgi:hypothetical protein
MVTSRGVFYNLQLKVTERKLISATVFKSIDGDFHSFFHKIIPKTPQRIAYELTCCLKTPAIFFVCAGHGQYRLAPLLESSSLRGKLLHRTQRSRLADRDRMLR